MSCFRLDSKLTETLQSQELFRNLVGSLQRLSSRILCGFHASADMDHVTGPTLQMAILKWGRLIRVTLTVSVFHCTAHVNQFKSWQSIESMYEILPEKKRKGMKSRLYALQPTSKAYQPSPFVDTSWIIQSGTHHSSFLGVTRTKFYW